MAKASKKEVAKKVNRTKSLVNAGHKLKDFRDRIDHIIQVINSGKDFHEDIASECIEIGVTIQGLSKLLRPLSVEGRQKAIKKEIRQRWLKLHKKAVKADDKNWIEKYSIRRQSILSYDIFVGPTEDFKKEYFSNF